MGSGAGRKKWDMSLLVLFIVAIFIYSLVSGRLERTVVTAPSLVWVRTLPNAKFSPDYS